MEPVAPWGTLVRCLLAVNPALSLNGYPQDWTQYTVNVSGLGVPATGRFALRYVVTDTSINADFIGIDSGNDLQWRNRFLQLDA